MNGIEYVDKLIPDAYHGTSKSNASNIEVNKKFIPSRGPDLFLGDGIYFFEGTKSLAEWWARKNFPNEEIGIIIAEIQLGRCLDLTIPEYRDLVKNAKCKIEKQELKENITDTLVINFICAIIEPEIETVRYISKRGALTKIYPGSRIYDSIHIAICVKKTNNILNFKIINGAIK